MESFWDIFNIPLGWLIKVCYELIPNYGVALLLFAIIVKIALSPFSVKQQKNSIKQASLQPKEQAIRKKYAGRSDKVTQEKLQREINELYQKENYNPLSGCLPMLIQFPLIIFIYNVVRSPLRYICGLKKDVVEEIKTLAGVKDEISALHSMQLDFGKFESLVGDLKLGDLPSFDIFGIDMSQNPEIALNWLILIPILNFAVSLFSSTVIRKLSYQPPKTNQTREAEMSAKIMTLSMPLLSVWITFSVPAVIGIYWIYQNLLGILQQFIMSKIYPIPKFTEEDYRQAELQLKGKTDKKKKKAERDPNRPRVRSLHYIDDEEYNAKVVDNPAPNGEKKVSSPFIEPIQTKDYSSDKRNGKKK